MALNTARTRSATAAFIAAAMSASALVLGVVGPAYAVDAGVVPDPGLRACVNDDLNRPDLGQPVTAADMATVTSLSCDGSGWEIKSLAGISYATELTSLWGSGPLTDAQVAPLKNLVHLESVRLAETLLTSIAPFAELPVLTNLEIQDPGDAGHIVSVAPAAVAGAFPALQGLALGGNRIADVGPLAQIDSLVWVDLDRNRVADLSPLGSLQHLEAVDAEDQAIADTSATVGVPTPNPVRDLEGKAVVPSIGAPYDPVARAFTFDAPGRFTGDWSLSEANPVTVSFTGAIAWKAGYALTPAVPAIGGAARVGSALTAKPGTWGPVGVSLSYQWRRNGAAIPGATGASYTVRAADLGARLSAAVTGSKTDYTTESRVSAASAPVAKGVLRAATPKISGAVKVGRTLKVKRGTWTSGTSFRYQWLRNGKKIAKATTSSYRLGAKDAGKRITVRVTGTKAGYVTVTKGSRASTRVMPR